MTERQKAIEDRLLRNIECSEPIHFPTACEVYLTFMKAVEISRNIQFCPHCYEKLIADTDALLIRKPTGAESASGQPGPIKLPYCRVINYPDEPCWAPVKYRLKDDPDGFFCENHAAMLMAYQRKRGDDFVKLSGQRPESGTTAPETPRAPSSAAGSQAAQ